MIYPYRCPECGPFEVQKPMSESARPEPCPGCGARQHDQDVQSKRIGGIVSRSSSWSGGKVVPQLHPCHPDRVVTSKSQMEQVYKKHGINLDTGKFVSKEAQIKATVPKNKRTGSTPDTVGGVDE